MKKNLKYLGKEKLKDIKGGAWATGCVKMVNAFGNLGGRVCMAAFNITH